MCSLKEEFSLASYLTIKSKKISEEKQVYRSTITDGDGATKWIKAYGIATNTSWIVERVKPPVKSVLKKSWSCQHSKKNKTELGEEKYYTGRNTCCKAKIQIKIKKVNRNTKKNDNFLRLEVPLPAVITICSDHNHSTECADALRLLRPTDEAKQRYIGYFDNGMSPSEARQLHQSKILVGDEPYITLANGSKNPPVRTIYAWHKQWRELNYGNQSNPLEKIRDNISAYKSAGIDVIISDKGPWAILIVTPIMKRAQELPSSTEIVFIDSTGSVDATQSSLTVMLTATKAGAIPIAVLIHQTQSTEGYETSFGLLRNNYPHCFGGKGSPEVFMTDNSTPEKQALRAMWPDSKQLLCHFHLGQQEWRWLLNSKNNVENKERRVLMSLFQRLMYANSAEELENAKVQFDELCKHRKYKERVHNMLSEDRIQEWVSLFRSFNTTRGHNTNNFSEAAIRVLKDIILCRTKAFNSAALVDFTASVWEKYFEARILEFAHNRKPAQRASYAQLLQKMPSGSSEKIEVLDEDVYLVPSGETGALTYEVNSLVGWCSCPVGKQGAFCKHQTLVHSKYGGLFPNAPPLSAENRYALGVLALGPMCPPATFFLSMEKKIPASVDVTMEEESTNTPLLLSSEICEEDNKVLEVSLSKQALEFPKEEFDKTKQELNSQLARIIELTKDCSVSHRHTKNIIKKLKYVETKEQATDTLIRMSYCLNKSRTSYIKVQPTSLSRRRQGVKRGSKRISAGRPSSKEPLLKIHKRKRSLCSSVRQNVSHIKTH